MSNKDLTPAQLNLVKFFSPVDASFIARHLRKCFECATFESEIAEEQGGRDALFRLYHIAELAEELVTETK